MDLKIISKELDAFEQENKCVNNFHIYIMFEDSRSGNDNSEEACTVLLEIITRNHRGFRVTKKDIGECWKNTCCYNKYINCGLGLTQFDKAEALYANTYLEQLLKESGVLDVADLY